MFVQVRLFGVFAEQFPGHPLSIQGLSYVSELEGYLKKLHPVFTQHTFRIAVNHTISPSDAPIRPNDEVAVLPPFSGG